MAISSFTSTQHNRAIKNNRANQQAQGEWFVCPTPKKNPLLRFVCFPHAGGNATTYRPWAEWLPEEVELLIVQPPGRSSRLLEAPIDCMAEIVEQLSSALLSQLCVPTVFFGHSLGAKTAYAFIHKLQDIGFQLPEHFIASGCRAPHLSSSDPIHGLDDESFVNRLRNLNGTPEQILKDQELMNLLLPGLRADFKLAETFVRDYTNKLAVPTTVIGGTEDHYVPRRDLFAWQQHFSLAISLHEFKGGHFFFEETSIAPLTNSIIGSAIRNQATLYSSVGG